MPLYRIHRIKEGPRENFRWAPHTGGLAIVKPKDYQYSADIQGDNAYNIWKVLSVSENPLCPGDVLELVRESPADGSGSGDMWITKYIGFEPAQWYVAEACQNQAANEHEAALKPVPEAEGCPS